MKKVPSYHINITDFECECQIGFYEDELKNKQKLIFNFALKVRNNVQNDNPETVFDYQKFCKKIQDIVSPSKFKLLESLGEYILDEVFKDKNFSNDILQLNICIKKPEATKYTGGNISLSFFRNLAL